MICVFPDPHPDELLYSVCARYSELMGYPNQSTATEDFFGKGASAIVDLPGRIDYLIRSLPPGHLYTADELIDKNTLFPFYAPFQPKGQSHAIRQAMRHDESARVAARIRRTYSGEKLIYLRFCPECASEDREAVGETYWHRIHQLHGIYVCPRHDVFLEDTKALWHCFSNTRAAMAAENYVHTLASRRIDRSNPAHLIHSRLASVASSLLDKARDSVDCEALARRYKELLVRHEFANLNRTVRITKLIDKIKESYPSELLTKIGCDIKVERDWINRLVSSQQTSDMQHPICHTLFLDFLNSSPEEVFDRFVEEKPFGDGPWPCLNPAVDHYKESRVLSCKVSPGTKKAKGKPRGVFSCACGFTYARVGPDIKASDRFTFTIVQTYGTTWESRLREMWGDKSYSIETIARNLAVSVKTLKKRVVALGMRFPRTAEDTDSNAEIHSRHKLRRESRNELLRRKKNALLTLIAANPQASRTELWKMAHSLVHYIRGADPKWLDKHMPPPRQRFIPRPRVVDWAKEDVLLAKAVTTALAKIKATEPPLRVSVKAISNRVGQLSRIRQHLDEMPRTAKLIKGQLETTEKFLTRRIRWVEDLFRREMTVPTRYAFSRRAQICRYVEAGNEVVCRAMEDALLRLESGVQESRQ